MRRMLAVLGDVALALGVAVLIPAVILLLGLPIAGAVKLLIVVAERL